MSVFDFAAPEIKVRGCFFFRKAEICHLCFGADFAIVNDTGFLYFMFKFVVIPAVRKDFRVHTRSSYTRL